MKKIKNQLEKIIDQRNERVITNVVKKKTRNSADSFTAKLFDIRSDDPKNLNRYIAPVTLQRLRHDVLMWREGVLEAESAYYPYRVRMQRMFKDIILDGHVKACIDKFKDLILLKDFCLIDENKKENEEVKKIFQKNWFNNFLNYALDAPLFGYTLMNIKDVVNGEITNVELIRRENISPDRKTLSTFAYVPSGIKFEEEPYNDWAIYIPTPSDLGTSPCGYGMLYNIGVYAIFLRNNLGYNGDFVELFAQPYRVGKTAHPQGTERDALENALKQMGSSGYAIIDPNDEIEFLETALGGTGYKAYDNLEKRCESKISKIILGYSDAIDTTPNKLGANDSQSESLDDKAGKLRMFIETVVNDNLIPKMRNIGVNIPEGLTWKIKNDNEKAEARKKEDASNLITAQIALNMANAGLQMDAAYFTERTGIPSEKIVAPTPAPSAPFSKDQKAKLKKLYK